MTEKENNIWVWESLTVKLTNPEGETITLNSLCFNDFTMTCVGKDLEEFVVSTSSRAMSDKNYCEVSQ